MSHKISYLSLAILCTLPVSGMTEETVPTERSSQATANPLPEGAHTTAIMPEVVVSAPRMEEPGTLQGSSLDTPDLIPLRAATSDTAHLLERLPGVNLYHGGGVSSLPVVHGLADDRVRINVDGREWPSACGNHMNPPLSIIDPSHIAHVEVTGGITPVSIGGDSIGGTIAIQSSDPEFASPGDGVLTKGRVATFVRSNGNQEGGNLGATLATDKWSLMLQGSTTQANDYKDGHGQTVQSTAFESNNYSAKLAARGDDNQVTLEVGGQEIPYQDFVNAHMDMTGNQAQFVNGRYEGQFGWGKLDAQLHWENTQHQMDVRGDKAVAIPAPVNYNPMFMPMNTDGTTEGYALKAEIPLSKRDTVRIGNEFTHFGLDDWWPPANTGPSMGPGTFQNINHGRRDRLGTFAEWNAQWDTQWSSLLGIRNDMVWMNTDNVVGYSGMYATDANAFNARDHARQDVNFDLTALLRYDPSQTSSYQGGYARKTRSPNLYERYLWSTGTMSSQMNSAVGDANGYVGNPDLKPEVAHTVSIAAGWHDRTGKQWTFKATPYYSRVQDFIDANRLSGGTTGLVKLQYANHDAQLYGLDLSGRTVLGNTTAVGTFALSGVVGYVRGKNLDTGDNLYHIMPINARLALEHERNLWSNTLEVQGVDGKDDVSSTRNELKTGGYGLVHLKTGYRWGQLRLNAGIDNLFDRFYNPPLGGAYWIGDKTAGTTPGTTPVPGMGRTAYMGMTVEF